MDSWRRFVQQKAKGSDILSIRPTAPSLHKDLTLLCGRGLTTKHHSSVILQKEG